MVSRQATLRFVLLSVLGQLFIVLYFWKDKLDRSTMGSGGVAIISISTRCPGREISPSVGKLVEVSMSNTGSIGAAVLRFSGLLACMGSQTLLPLPRFVGPFTVLARESNVYTLVLSSSRRTHPTFYVGLLKPWPRRDHGALRSLNTLPSSFYLLGIKRWIKRDLKLIEQ